MGVGRVLNVGDGNVGITPLHMPGVKITSSIAIFPWIPLPICPSNVTYIKQQQKCYLNKTISNNKKM